MYSSRMESPDMPSYRISHEQHPYMYSCAALNIFGTIDDAQDDGIDDDNDSVNTQATESELEGVHAINKKKGT